ncbi:MAG: transcriptional regulator NrdR [Patescibacteria group bacterium]
MHCPVCNSTTTKVTDSRVGDEGMSVKRRRECEKCQYRFTTREEIELLDLVVVKRDGRRESYSKEKIVQGLEKSLHKVPYTREKFVRMVQNIERDIQKLKQREVQSGDIGEIMMRRLKAFNKVAYIRFASVYRSFQDVSGFQDELKKFKKAKKRVA